MKRRTLLIWVVPFVLVALVLGGAAIAGATGGDDGDAGLKGPQADHARAAALKITGGGKANAVERDSEQGATYEVEVTRPDGETVDVRLDASYKLVAVEGDSEQADSHDQN